MAEFIGLFGRVADVKAVKSLGVCRVVIEVPIEQHRQVTNGFWDADVLVTLWTASRAMAWRPAVNHQLTAAMMRGRLKRTMSIIIRRCINRAFLIILICGAGRAAMRIIRHG